VPYILYILCGKYFVVGQK